ncbi:MAG: hypothetical protein FD135_2410 [Comamonadaceae bacterium]|nr:MAG: hypothetical protein FD135_2410 [Comamonadaceae bacterium]
MLRKFIPALVTTAAALGVTHSAVAQERQTATSQLDTTVTLLSDQRTRGVSDSLMSPAIKLGVQYVHESGFVALAEIVSASQKTFTNSDGHSLTLAGGYRFGDPEGWHYGVGLATEIFPGAKFDAPHGFDPMVGPTDFRSSNYNTSFAVLEIGYGALEGRILNVLSKTYRAADTGGVCGQMLDIAFSTGADLSNALTCYGRGDQNSRGTLLFDLDYKFAVAPATTLTLHAGYQKVANFAEANFSDVDFVTTRTKTPELFMVRDGTDLRRIDNNKVVLSVSRRF